MCLLSTLFPCLFKSFCGGVIFPSCDASVVLSLTLSSFPSMTVSFSSSRGLLFLPRWSLPLVGISFSSCRGHPSSRDLSLWWSASTPTAVSFSSYVGLLAMACDNLLTPGGGPVGCVCANGSWWSRWVACQRVFLFLSSVTPSPQSPQSPQPFPPLFYTAPFPVFTDILNSSVLVFFSSSSTCFFFILFYIIISDDYFFVLIAFIILVLFCFSFFLYLSFNFLFLTSLLHSSPSSTQSLFFISSELH